MSGSHPLFVWFTLGTGLVHTGHRSGSHWTHVWFTLDTSLVHTEKCSRLTTASPGVSSSARVARCGPRLRADCSEPEEGSLGLRLNVSHLQTLIDKSGFGPETHAIFARSTMESFCAGPCSVGAVFGQDRRRRGNSTDAHTGNKHHPWQTVV